MHGSNPGANLMVQFFIHVCENVRKSTQHALKDAIDQSREPSGLNQVLCCTFLVDLLIFCRRR